MDDDLEEFWEQLGWEAWKDPGGPAPDDAGWLTPADGTWEWDGEALMMGEMIGFPLYLRLRDRLCELDVPTQAHHVLIQEMIDCHDIGQIETGTGLSTLVFHDDGTSAKINMSIMDHTDMPVLSALGL